MSCCHGLSLRQDPPPAQGWECPAGSELPWVFQQSQHTQGQPMGLLWCLQTLCDTQWGGRSRQQTAGWAVPGAVPAIRRAEEGLQTSARGSQPIVPPSKTSRTGTSPRQELLLPESVLKNKTWQVPSSHVKSEKASQARLVSAGVCRPGWQQEGPQQAGALHFVRIQPLELSSPSDG